MSDNFMKGFWEGMAYTLALAFVFFPWVLGFVDGLSIFLTGNYLTSVPWSEYRAMMALFWPIFWIMIASCF